jgi:hypothetical protein
MCRGVREEPIGLLSSIFSHTILPIAGGWIGECQGVSTRRWAMTTAPRWNRKVRPLRFRQSAMIQKQKNRLDKVSLISKKI